MFKLIEVIQWENDKAVALCYADASTDLGPTVSRNGKSLTLAKGSLAYLSNGEVYVYGNSWTKMGA